MTPVLDPAGTHLAALRRLGEFSGRRVLEMGCGDGRLTLGIVPDPAHVLAFDPDADAIGRARRALPELVEHEHREQRARSSELAVVGVTVANGRITALDVVVDPAKLARVTIS